MTAQIIIYENEDEDELINKFVELSARYPEYTAFDIAAEVFKGLVDPWSRANAAAQVWANSLEIRERIRTYDRRGAKTTPSLTFEEWQAEVLAVTRDENLGTQAKKVMLDGLRLVGESNAWIKKAIEKKTEDVTKRLPNFLIKRYEDEQPARP